MRFLVTSGPTYEPLDQVRRLTNFSTSKLGTELANYLSETDHSVTLLQGFYSTHSEPSCAEITLEFTTTQNLLDRLKQCSNDSFDAVFHAAAVSDFGFGKVFRKTTNGLEEMTSGKFSTREGTLLAELVPTQKLISEMRMLFPKAKIFGWKYDVDGTHEGAIALGLQQIQENRTDYSIVNGPAYGHGFGIVSASGQNLHCLVPADLYRELLRLVSVNPLKPSAA